MSEEHTEQESNGSVSDRVNNLSDQQKELLKRVMDQHKGAEQASVEGKAEEPPPEAVCAPPPEDPTPEEPTEEEPPPQDPWSAGSGNKDTPPWAGMGQDAANNPWAAMWQQAATNNPWAGMGQDAANNPWADMWQQVATNNPWAGMGQDAANNPWAAMWQQAATDNPWADMGAGAGNRNPFQMPPDFGGDGPPEDTVVGLKPKGDRPPFFLVHAVFGSVFPYHRLALHMDPDQPVYGIQSIGLDGKSKPPDRIEDMAELYIEHMRAVQPEGPYYLGGYSFGGWVAYEMARLLVGKYKEIVGLTAVLGVGIPMGVQHPAMMEAGEQWAELIKNYTELMINTNLSDQQRVDTGPIDPTTVMTPLQKVAYANNLAQLRYAPPPYSGHLDLFVTRDMTGAVLHDESMGWRQMAKDGVTTHICTGNHISTFKEPHVQDLAQKLTACLDKAFQKT